MLKRDHCPVQGKHHVVAALLIALGVYSCDQPFDPSAPLEKRLIVFSVLSTDHDAQFVRVQSSYQPLDNNPIADTTEREVIDARVFLVDSSSTFELRDTLLTGTEPPQQNYSGRAYALPGFVPNYGASYRVEVQSPTLGSASGSVVIPDKSDLTLDVLTSNVLRIPYRFTDTDPIQITTPMTRKTKAFIFRMYLYYDVLKGNEWVEERSEIPIASATGRGYSLADAQYGGIVLSRPGTLVLGYSNGYYLQVIKNLTTERYKENRITYKWVVFIMLQMEENLYRYYSSVHEYQDPLSVRLDQPIYSNLTGGFGLVGAYTLDSLVYVLPAKFDGNR